MKTDITEMAQSLKAAAEKAADNFDPNMFVQTRDILALVEALDKSEKTSEARREAIDRTHNMFVRERDRANAAEEALEKAQAIRAAAEKLVRCKGRYHSEQNYRALAALFGVTTPDLPPLDSEPRTVTVDADVSDRNQPGMVVAVHIDAGDFVKFRGQVYEVEETDFDDHDVTLWFVCGETLKCAAGCQIEVVTPPEEAE
ncbi:TPA: hypothetical protein OME04_000564 [Klebsiella oxytoca]|nr:hypothetical protein [Klebsiella oxytoca]